MSTKQQTGTKADSSSFASPASVATTVSSNGSPLSIGPETNLINRNQPKNNKRRSLSLSSSTVGNNNINNNNNNSRRVTFDSHAMKSSTVHITMKQQQQQGSKNINRNNNNNGFSPTPETPTRSMMNIGYDDDHDDREESPSSSSNHTPGREGKNNKDKKLTRDGEVVDTVPVMSSSSSSSSWWSVPSFIKSATGFISNVVKKVTGGEGDANASDQHNSNQNNNLKNLGFKQQQHQQDPRYPYLVATRQPIRRERNNQKVMVDHDDQKDSSNNKNNNNNNNNTYSRTNDWDAPVYSSRATNAKWSSSSRNNRKNDDDNDNGDDDALSFSNWQTKTPLFSSQLLSASNNNNSSSLLLDSPSKQAMATWRLDQTTQQQENTNTNYNDNQLPPRRASSSSSFQQQRGRKQQQQHASLSKEQLASLLDNESVLSGLLDQISVTAARKTIHTQVQSCNDAVQEVIFSVVRKIVIDEIHKKTTVGVASSSSPSLLLQKRIERNTTASADYISTRLALSPSSSSSSSNYCSFRTDEAIEEILRPANNNASYKIGAAINGFQLTARDFSSLRPGTWLTDMVINCYIEMAISPEFMHLRRKNLQKSQNSVILLNSHFFSKLEKEGIEAAKRWILDLDIFAARLILIPVNQNNVHWTLISVDVCENRFCFWDSMGSSGKQAISRIRNFFQQIYNERRQMRRDILEPMSESELRILKTAATKKARRQRADLLTPMPAVPPCQWTVYAPQRASPQQSNSHDCGMFTNQTAVNLIWGTDLWENVNDAFMIKMRNIVAIELKNGKFLPRC